MKRIAWIVALLLTVALLAGCGGHGRTASDGDLPTQPVSSGDLTENTLQDLLTANDGAWRSEQTTGADDVVVVRELELHTDGSFRYREGPEQTPFSYWAQGAWELDGDTLRLSVTPTDQNGNAQGEDFTAEYSCQATGDELALQLTAEPGLHEDTAGFIIHYYQP